MASTESLPTALVISGDERIVRLLGKEDTVVIPAYACRLDGFVNDTFTEYAASSVYRPASVCRARLVSSLQDVVRPAGNYYLGFTMYTAAGRDEPVEIWIGHRPVARVCVDTGDNRLHLFVAPEGFRFRGGERIRLITGATNGPCRIENVVLLSRRPRPTESRLDILHPHVDLSREGEKVQARVTWITSRPAKGSLRWGKGKRAAHRVSIPDPAVNHEVLLEGLEVGRSHAYEIHLQDETSALKVVYKGIFRTDVDPPESRVNRASFPLLCRRPAPGDAIRPVSTGVPFPRGALGNCEAIRLLDTTRTEAPLQARSLSRWPDGSVRWALLDFESGGEDLRVEYGRQIAREPVEAPLEIIENRAGITITTGPLRVEFKRDAAVLPGLVSLLQADGIYQRLTPKSPAKAVRLVADDGTAYEAGKPEKVVLEEAGPLRACVRIEVRHSDGRGTPLFLSLFRVHLFRGRSDVRVLHTFENDRAEEEFTRIRSLELRADFDAGAGLEARVGPHRFETLKKQPISLRQVRDNRYTLKQGTRLCKQGRRTRGSAELRGDRARAILAVRDFWQNYPKGIEVDRGGITLQICPPLDRSAYPRGGEEEDRLYYYLLDGRYKFKCGVSRTHEFWFHFGMADQRSPSNFRDCVQTPPLYSVSLSAFNRSRALAQLPSREPSPFPPYEEWVETAHSAYAEDREESRAYGMLNYGDWFGERTYNWGNQEYDAAWCFLQEYLRDGHPDFYTWAEEAARHLVDVDTCHHGSQSTAVGEQYVHCVGHVGGYYPEGYRERAIFTGSWSPSHTWVEGPFLYHLLSGDARALESGLKTCDLLVGEILNHYDFTNCRNCGWHLIHLSAAYRATSRRIYLNAARIIVERVLERQRSSGGWDRLMVPGHCYCNPPRHTGNAGFMVGILMVGLERYYQATGDRRCSRAIVRAADYCIDSMWVPEKSAFRYTSCPLSSVGGGADMRILKGVAAAYRFSGKERFREVLLAGVQSALAGRQVRARRGVGKSICSPMRGAPQVLVGLPEKERSVSS